ncbi:methyl-accepting chemotaxis protein [Halosimplex pelagicum]|uniref:HAMP domain-containing protein n=1 Tax=Halosimplex pelagicum TaxID=869886 RepID=A0A7D5TSE9_9EURY|nr:methyl-accepting chemotaxis protein [Halosimplex pelagicum]QLH81952.1 HAMP domain-containing protein [Halosimplex pelagicum]
MDGEDSGGVGSYVPDVIRGRFVLKLAAVVAVAVVVSSAIGLMFYANATDRIDSQLSDRVTSTAQLQAQGLERWVGGVRHQTRLISQAPPFQRDDREAIDYHLLRQGGRMSESILDVHYVDSHSREVLVSTNDSVEGTNLSRAGVPWARDRAATVGRVTNIAERVFVASEPYESPSSGERVLAFVSAAPKNTENLVVVEADLGARAQQFHQTVDEASTTVQRRNGARVMGTLSGNATLPGELTSAESAGLTRGDGNVVGFAPVDGTDWTVATVVPASAAYSMRNYVGSSLLAGVGATVAVFAVATIAFGRRSAKTLDDLAERARAIEDGDLDVDCSTDRVDEFGRLYGAFDEMRDSLREQIAAAESARDEAEQARERAEAARAEADEAKREAERLNDRLEARASEYGDVMAACAAGDLTRRLDAEADSDAMAEIATAYNDMMDEWEATIRRVRAFGEAVGTAAADVTETVDDVRDRSAGVRDAAETMSDDAAAQSAKLDAVWAELDDLSATVEEVSTVADSVRTTADETLERSEAGREAAAAAADALGDIEDSTDETLAQVEALDDLTAEIEAVTDLIGDIAEQTNMLALNANIEAARAGTDGGGDGFAVVAAEVEELSEETVEATAEIESAIDRMRGQMETAVDEVTATSRKVSAGTETVADALAAFDDIADGIEATTDGVREIDRATAEQAESTQEVVAMVESVSEIGDRTAAQSDAVADDATEQSAVVDEVGRDIGTLADRAAELDDALAAFDVETDSGSAGEGGSGLASDRGRGVERGPDAGTDAGADDRSEAPPLDTTGPDAQTDEGDERVRRVESSEIVSVEGGPVEAVEGETGGTDD